MTSRINDIDRQAAEWLAKTDGITPSAEVQNALDAWLAQDARHLGAYLRAKTILARIERHSDVLSEYQIAAPTWRTWPSRRIVLTGGLAASIVAAAIIFGLRSQPAQPLELTTGIGERQSVSLADRSVATLNTDSKIDVRYSADRRSVTLQRGEAIFVVAKDKARPFVVTVQGAEVRAVGTRFSVRSLPDRSVEILVEEGVVRIDGRVAHSIPALRANSSAIVSAAAVVVKPLSPEEVSQKLAWRDGRVVFRHQTLEAAAREFSRYSRIAIVIPSPDVAKLTVTGAYATNDPVGFAKAVALALDLEADVKDNEVLLTRDKR